MAIDPVAPDVTPETEQEWETRSQFRRDLLDRLDELLIAAEHTIEGGPEDGVKAVTHKAWIEILRASEFAPLPAIDRHYAEVVTGANVIVWATCPRCGIPGVINLQIDPELRVDTSSAELRLKAKAKPRTHTCGQLLLPAAPEGQESFELQDIVEDGADDAGDEDQDEDGADDAGDEDQDADGADDAGDEDQDADADLLPGEIRCEGSNHVPNCEHFDQPPAQA
jgi:hypothetical protein